MLSDSNFMSKLVDYDKDNISDAVLRKLKKYIENPKFTPEAVEKVSKVTIVTAAFFMIYFTVSN